MDIDRLFYDATKVDEAVKSPKLRDLQQALHKFNGLIALNAY